MEGEKLKTIFQVIKWLNVEEALCKDDTPFKKSPNFNIAMDFQKLLVVIPKIMCLAVIPPARTKLGFIALKCDYKLTYWTQIFPGFRHAIDESLSSLESLAESINSIGNDGLYTKTINELYRKLSSFYKS